MVRQFPDLEELSRAAAAELAQLARQAISTRGRLMLVLSGGSTPRRLYQLLADPPHRTELPWDRVEFFWADERAVPPDHKDSNFAMACEAMLRKLAIPAAQLHRIRAEKGPELAAREYEDEIARAFHVSPGGEPPAFDLVLLGLGADGHTASLFPESEALSERRRWVVPNRHTPTDRITMTPPIINAARNVWFLVSGLEKASALRAVLTGPPDPVRLPAQVIRPASGKLVWFVDRLAASELPASPDGSGGSDEGSSR
jgi:6-phosphogluconolactonase